MYILVEACGPNIKAQNFPDAYEAQYAMMHRFDEVAKSCDDFSDEEDWALKEVGCNKTEAFIYDGPDHEDYFWKIFQF